MAAGRMRGGRFVLNSGYYVLVLALAGMRMRDLAAFVRPSDSYT